MIELTFKAVPAKIGMRDVRFVSLNLLYVSAVLSNSYSADGYCSPCRVSLGYTLHRCAREVAHAAGHHHRMQVFRTVTP